MEMHNPAHPGELLREYLPETMTVTEAAERHAPNSFSRAERPGRHQRRYGFAPGCRAQNYARLLVTLASTARFMGSKAKAPAKNCAIQACGLSTRTRKNRVPHLCLAERLL